MNRRWFLIALVLTGLAQGPEQTTRQSDSAAPEHPWGTPVLDMHFHSRSTPEADLLHLEGAGETMAVLLTRAPGQLEIADGAVGKYLGRFFLFASVDVTRQDATDILRKTGIAGTRGFGELSGVNVAIDGPEMQRVYKLAAEMQMLPPAKRFTGPQSLGWRLCSRLIRRPSSSGTGLILGSHQRRDHYRRLQPRSQTEKIRERGLESPACDDGQSRILTRIRIMYHKDTSGWNPKAMMPNPTYHASPASLIP